MKNVVVRSLSGIVYVALIVGAIMLGKWTFMCLTLLFTILGVYEFTTMAHNTEADKKSYAVIGLVDMFFAALICLLGIYENEMILISGFFTVFTLMIYFLVRAILALADRGEHAYREVAKSVLSVIYIALPMNLLNLVYGYNSTFKELVLIMFVMIWLNDTGAFCFGSTFGKRRLCERLSPKKSWEGFWGGFGCCVAFGALCYWQFNNVDFPLWVWLLYGALVSVFATWGDLFESMLKRTVKVKDSGNLIPGHGGILDRIDSLLFVAPVTFFVSFFFLF